MKHLKEYACWLEDHNIDWRHFPKRKSDRCLFRYRGYLIEQRDTNKVKPSTATARIAAVVRFYRWAQIMLWIDREDLWDDRLKRVYTYDVVGFRRTLSVVSSELSIPNRKRPGGLELEGGLLPITAQARDKLLTFLLQHESDELYHMMRFGFFTGARSQTIRTLRRSSLESAQVDLTNPELFYVPVGTGTPVKTKQGVYGRIMIPKSIINELLNYAASVGRLSRSALASPENKDVLFLTAQGNPYSENTFTKLMSDLRIRLLEHGHGEYQNFKFHQTRATYGTMLAQLAIDTLPNITDAICFVRDAMLHKNESTTWKYIKFIEKSPLREKLSTEFFAAFSGITS